MPETMRVNINPLLEILSKDMDLYYDMYFRVIDLKWKSKYGKDEAVAELQSIREILDLDKDETQLPETETEFAKLKGECGRTIMQEIKNIRKEVQEVIKSITKEDFTFGRSSSEGKEVTGKPLVDVDEI